MAGEAQGVWAWRTMWMVPESLSPRVGLEGKESLDSGQLMAIRCVGGAC